jgi:hypothetical protein
MIRLHRAIFYRFIDIVKTRAKRDKKGEIAVCENSADWNT